MENREEWKEVKGYEGLYEVSYQGNVRSVHRVLKYKNGALREWVSIPIKQRIRKRYMSVRLNNSGTSQHHSVHRLVMAAFIGDCPKGLQVNHKDGEKHNNCASNLEYVTNNENMKHAKDLRRKKRYGLEK